MVNLEWRGLTLTAACNFYPEIAARLSGPPENCSPAEGGECEIVALTYRGHDARFLLRADELGDELHDLAYAACVASDRREADADAADRQYERRYAL